MQNRPLRVFLCHSSLDKKFVRELWHDLRSAGFAPWLDEEELLPGQEWEPEIERAVRESDCFLACLSSHSVDKAGYLHKEIRVALDVADLQPEGAIFIIPLKLDDFDLPTRLSKWQWVDWHRADALQHVIRSLDARAADIGAASSTNTSELQTIPPYRASDSDNSVAPNQLDDSLDGAGVARTATREELIQSQPDGWEYLLLAAVVTEGIEKRRDARRAYDLGIINPTGHPLTEKEAKEALNTEMTALGRIFGNTEPLINDHLATALGSPGEPGDARLIVDAAGGLVSMYAAALAWAERVRSHNVPPGLEEAASLVALLAEQPLRDVDDWVEKLSKLRDDLPELLKRLETSDETIEINLSLVLTANEKLAKRAHRALR